MTSMESAVIVEKTFLSDTYAMSLWEVAHRWAELHPFGWRLGPLPLPVRDRLIRMMQAQLDSELWVLKPDGHAFKDWSYIRHWTDYHPYEEQQWDGTDEHKRELYLQTMNKIVKPHDNFIARHTDMVSGSKPLNRQYLKSVFVQRDNLAEWACFHDLPFPSFWFGEEEAKEFLREALREKVIRAKVQSYYLQGKEVTDEINEQILSEIENLSDQELAKVLFSPGRVTVKDIDTFWERLSDAQRSRILCRVGAQKLWSERPDSNIEMIVHNPLIQDFCGGKYYPGKDTIRNWIKDLDPRPPEKRRGRPTKQ